MHPFNISSHHRCRDHKLWLIALRLFVNTSASHIIYNMTNIYDRSPFLPLFGRISIGRGPDSLADRQQHHHHHLNWTALLIHGFVVPFVDFHSIFFFHYFTGNFQCRIRRQALMGVHRYRYQLPFWSPDVVHPIKCVPCHQHLDNHNVSIHLWKDFNFIAWPVALPSAASAHWSVHSRQTYIHKQHPPSRIRCRAEWFAHWSSCNPNRIMCTRVRHSLDHFRFYDRLIVRRSKWSNIKSNGIVTIKLNEKEKEESTGGERKFCVGERGKRCTHNNGEHGLPMRFFVKSREDDFDEWGEYWDEGIWSSKLNENHRFIWQGQLCSKFSRFEKLFSQHCTNRSSIALWQSQWPNR